MKNFIHHFSEGVYEGLQQQEEFRGQVTLEEIEELAQSFFCSFINKVSVLLGILFIYFFFLSRGENLSSFMIVAISFWMAWVVSTNHLTKLQKFLDEHKKKNKS